MALFSCEPSIYFLLEDTVNHVALGTFCYMAIICNIVHLYFLPIATRSIIIGLWELAPPPQENPEWATDHVII